MRNISKNGQIIEMAKYGPHRIKKKIKTDLSECCFPTIHVMLRFFKFSLFVLLLGPCSQALGRLSLLFMDFLSSPLIRFRLVDNRMPCDI